MIEDHPDDENRPTVSQADPDYQVSSKLINSHIPCLEACI
jgi:hypothetical protein